jgi:hypothetical protein
MLLGERAAETGGVGTLTRGAVLGMVQEPEVEMPRPAAMVVCLPGRRRSEVVVMRSPGTREPGRGESPRAAYQACSPLGFCVCWCACGSSIRAAVGIRLRNGPCPAANTGDLI